MPGMHVFRTLPPLAVALGILGIIPFALLGIGAVGASPDSSLTAARALVGYGAVILAFLGGVHWGFTLSEEEDARAERARLTLGVVPSLVGWSAIFLQHRGPSRVEPGDPDRRLHRNGGGRVGCAEA